MALSIILLIKLLWILSYVSCENHERSSTALYYDDLREVYTIPSPEELADNNAIKTNESTLDLMIKPDDKPVTRTTTTTSSTTITPDTDTDTNTEEASTDTVTGFNDTRPLKRVFLSNRSIVCNDGSQAGFYLRKALYGNSVWIVFLEGGWYCYDHHSCRNRWMRLRHLMTSSQWPETRYLNGVLSGSSSENPYWHSANHVTVPYCSSDTWSGTATRKDSGFHFMGKLIVNQVIRDLVPLGLSNATQLILAGTSAGGTGAMINLDPVQHLLHVELGLKHIAIRGITDSGWFLDRTPYSPNTLPAVDAIKKGHILWQGSLPKRCLHVYPQEPWRCYFGYRLYPTLRAPLFVFQFLFDEAQMTAENVRAPSTPQQWDYIHTMGRALRDSFENVSAVFAPSCVSHSILTKKDWLRVRIDGVSVAKALRCWELATSNNRRRLRSNKFAKKMVRAGPIETRNKEKKKRKQLNNNNAVRLNHGEIYTNKSVKNKGKRIRLNRSRNNANKPQPSHENGKKYRHRNRKHNISQGCHTHKGIVSNGPGDKRFRCNSYLKHNKVNRTSETNNKQTLVVESRRLERSLIRTEERECLHRHIERCSWPQCSHSCPQLLDPYTGDQVHFIDMLKSFGLQMDSVAKALGVDIHTLNNMEHSELLNLLTQQAN